MKKNKYSLGITEMGETLGGNKVMNHEMSSRDGCRCNCHCQEASVVGFSVGMLGGTKSGEMAEMCTTFVSQIWGG